MYSSLLLATVLISFVTARPRPDVNPQCANVPTNPWASQIDAKYLAIPGCGGAGGGTNSGSTGSGSTGSGSTGSGGSGFGGSGSGGSGSGGSGGSSSSTSRVPLSVSTGTPGGGNTGGTGGIGSGGSTGGTNPNARSGLHSGGSTGGGTGGGTGGSTGGSTDGTLGGSTGGGSGAGNNTAGVEDITPVDRSPGGDLSRIFTASVTRYGQGPDGTPGTDNSCQHNQGACGNNPISGWTAAVNVFLYVNGASGMGGDGSSGVPGKACGTCWNVTGSSDLSGKPMSITSIVVLITNECAKEEPGQKKNSCGMTSFDEHDDHGNEVLVDLCMDSGASRAFWGPPPWGASSGTTHQVSCDQWCGTYANGTKSGPPGCVAPGESWELVDKSKNPSTFY